MIYDGLFVVAWRDSHGIGDALYVEQRVEWQFAFDIHCNSFFIVFLLLYVVQVKHVVVLWKGEREREDNVCKILTLWMRVC